MNLNLFAFIALSASSLPFHGTSCGAQTITLRPVRYENGQWFDGTKFVQKTVRVVDRTFASSRASANDSVVDLQGRYVIPPFGEAHNHHFLLPDGPMAAATHAKRYLQQGIAYAAIPNVVLHFFNQVRPLINKPGSVDVAFSVAGLTAPDGHPTQMFRIIATNGLFNGWTVDSLPGRAWVAVASLADLDGQFGRVTAGNPDFIKIYLEHSETDGRGPGQNREAGTFGLAPALVPEIVRRSHAQRLPVAAHVASAADFRIAVNAGVDRIMHLPLDRLSEADAVAAARRKVSVVTTTRGHTVRTSAAQDEIFRHNIRTLRSAGAQLLFGTDDIDLTVVDELMNVRRLGVMSDTALLYIATIATPQAIFPQRKIGRLDPGREASFVVLEQNPLADLNNVRRVRLVIKQGQVVPR